MGRSGYTIKQCDYNFVIILGVDLAVILGAIFGAALVCLIVFFAVVYIRRQGDFNTATSCVMGNLILVFLSFLSS